jgi:hypothetical protein
LKRRFRILPLTTATLLVILAVLRTSTIQEPDEQVFLFRVVLSFLSLVLWIRLICMYPISQVLDPLLRGFPVFVRDMRHTAFLFLCKRLFRSLTSLTCLLC